MAAKGGKRPGSGRPKGTPNKHTAQIKEMVIDALSNKGGVKYLMRQADENPVAFMGLVGKVIPLQVNHADNEGGKLVITWQTDQTGRS